MKKTNLYIGLNDKDTKRQEVNTLEAFKIVQNAAVNIFGGGTIYEVTGFYTHNNGVLVEEKSLKLELVDVTAVSVNEFVHIIKIALNQESVLKTEEVIDSCYI